MKPNPKRVLAIGVVVVVVYLLGFFVLWLGGGYAANRSGRTREHFLATGYPFWDRVEWQPLMGNSQPNYQWPGSNADH